MGSIIEIIDRLAWNQDLSDDEFISLIRFSYDISKRADDDWEHDETLMYLFEKARAKSMETFGNKIYTRGLIEVSNYCKNDCLYCGIRRSNRSVARYRLSTEDILECCSKGYELGFRTFVLQGGEDSYFSGEKLAEMVREIKRRFPECAVTLSLGEKTESEYRELFEAGADRYLLRHETADKEHYAMLHPAEMSCENRLNCLRTLKKIGFQTGCGIMVGTPGQTEDCLLQDLRFMQELKPEMIGIGPFIPHHETPFADCAPGSMVQTLVLLSILRLMFPRVLLPSTTALGTIHPLGREKGILAGANVLMPNLSPVSVREKYELYDNKICTGEEAAECRNCLGMRMMGIGYELAVDRGDHPDRTGKRIE